jgi:hypothetical protein
MKRPLRVRVSVARNITSRPLHSDQRKFDRWIADGIEGPRRDFLRKLRRGDGRLPERRMFKWQWPVAAAGDSYRLAARDSAT